MYTVKLHELAAEYYVRDLHGISDLLIFIEYSGRDVEGTIIQLNTGTVGEEVTLEMQEPLVYFSKFLIDIDRGSEYSCRLARLLDMSCSDIVDAMEESVQSTRH